MADNQQSRLRIRWWEVIVVGMIVCGLFAILYPAVENMRNPNGLYGEMYPTEPPDESNRVLGRDGLSIIAPVNWDIADNGHGGLRIAARGAPLRRLKSVIRIRELSQSPEPLQGYREIPFQDGIGYEVCQVLREDSFDDAASSSYDLYLERDGKWWNVNFLVADSITELPDSIRQYINTIHFPSVTVEE